MHLHNDRNKIIKLFEDKYINPTDFPYNAETETEPEVEYESEYEPEFEESIEERTKK